MGRYIFIGLGGMIGAILRYELKRIPLPNYHELLPLNTLIVNISGCFLLALLLTVSYEAGKISPNLRLGLSTGFLGAYTTFSTLCKETFVLIEKGGYFSAITYLTGSIFLGLCAVYLGMVTAREIMLKIAGKNKVLSSAKVETTEDEVV